MTDLIIAACDAKEEALDRLITASHARDVALATNNETLMDAAFDHLSDCEAAFATALHGLWDAKEEAPTSTAVY